MLKSEGARADTQRMRVTGTRHAYGTADVGVADADPYTGPSRSTGTTTTIVPRSYYVEDEDDWGFRNKVTVIGRSVKKGWHARTARCPSNNQAGRRPRRRVGSSTHNATGPDAMTNPTKYPILDTISDDFYDEYEDMPKTEARAAMIREITFQAKVFKTEDGYKVALDQGDKPSEYDDGPTAATRAGANELKDALLAVLNSAREQEARLKQMAAERKKGKAEWEAGSRKQLAADQVELNGALDLKLEVGDTIILKGYDTETYYRRRSAAKWSVMLLTEDGLTGWSRLGYTSQADAVMYERDEAPGRMVVVKDGKAQQVRSGKPKALKS